jgi:hypothetical protein
MRHRPDPLTLGAGAALLLCAAFMASFLFGLRGDRAPAPGARGATLPPPPVAPVGRVEVLNASGRSGLARAATDRLRAGGFDVVHFGNAAGHDGDSSVVVVRSASDDAARSAARQLGIAQIRTQVDTSLFVDATVILGRDWPAAAEATAPAADGWRARIGRWLRPGR